MEPLRVAAFYRFSAFPDFALHGAALKARCVRLAVRGTILLAPEGINGTVAGAAAAVDEIIAALRALPGFHELQPKYSTTHAMPFRRLKVRLKKEIVTMGVAGLDPSSSTGTLVEPAGWNALIADPEVMVIDTRNHFEVERGSFEGAIDPMTGSFGEFPAFVQEALADAKSRKIAMFCTGGIRCEKASSYLLREGFTEVYQLKGGILNYLENIPQDQSLWRGSCFVFDEREALGHGLEEFESHSLLPREKVAHSAG